ncbi:protein of unknown function DUF323 [Paenibacillus curdlanolyticus YK9]|uniref:Sulfatase-modifying factor enzyme-like domain-containing protein n=1 Tax=Paenibacillus curdlanolyticus YK9 TaxID=717606 RepID=E0IAB7_9BACL|nr:SUMF1/EgtB/PvdO family nonheme iron enzyme [Paenibacillus curdlanolyticus]EFM10694.1 protein of unknown function DUF323 [Paenibacillus curdlanolyticus YK9]
MRKRLVFLLIAMMAIASACSQETLEKAESPAQKADAAVRLDGMVFVEGGAFKNAKSSYYGKTVTLSNFYISQYEVTQQEWVEVMGSNPSQFKGSALPVEMVSWYDAVAYCNKRSIREGLTPYYNINKSKRDPNNKSEYDSLKWTVTINAGANGYRLPTAAEWEYAAGGGRKSKGYTYSGSNNADEVAWYWRNAGDKRLLGDWNWPAIEQNHNQTQTIGGKKPNELGLYDMSGNVREWVWDWYEDEAAGIASGVYRALKGGGWMGDVTSIELTYRGKFEANGFGPDQGFRVSRGE